MLYDRWARLCPLPQPETFASAVLGTNKAVGLSWAYIIYIYISTADCLMMQSFCEPTSRQTSSRRKRLCYEGSTNAIEHACSAGHGGLTYVSTTRSPLQQTRLAKSINRTSTQANASSSPLSHKDLYCRQLPSESGQP